MKLKIQSIALFISFLSFGIIGAQVPKLSKDINDAYQSSNPNSFIEFNGIVYFSAISGLAFGNELWRTDGTDSGTYMVKDINVGGLSSNPSNFTVGDNVLFFSADDGVNGIELWKTDGTDTGTQLVKNIRPVGSSSPLNFCYLPALKSILFSGNDGVTGYELWISDGTENGTSLLKSIHSGGTSSSPNSMTLGGQFVYFIANDGIAGNELWVSDGTANGTFLLRDIRIGTSPSSITKITAIDTFVFFIANDGNTGNEVWVSNGSSNGTFILKDINNGTNSSFPNNLIEFDSKLFFTANDLVHGNELWVSDGTVNGTYMYMDYRKGSASSGFSDLTIYKNKLFFSGNGSGRELMMFDATDTIIEIDVNPNGGSSPSQFNVVGDKLFFLATVDNGNELYVTDGTANGTKMTRDLYPIQTDAQIRNLKVVDSTLYFVSHQSPYYQNFELYAVSAKNTYPARVIDIIPGPIASNPTNFFAYKGKLLFTVNDEVIGNELWISESTTSAKYLKDIFAGTKDAGILSIAPYKNGVMFNAITSVGDELWKSDGSFANTEIVDDIKFGTASSSPRNLFTDLDRVYFTATELSNTRLFYSDGSLSGANYVYFGGGDYTYQSQKRVGDILYVTFPGFTSNNLHKYVSGSSGSKVKTLNPSNLGDNIKNLTEFRGQLYFSGDDGNTNGNELWMSDGSVSGTKLVKNIRSSYDDSDPDNFIVLDTMLLFSANNGSNGSELWISFGETSNTKLLKDINVGAANSGISQMTLFKNRIYFTANDGVNGNELWVSDGTDTGTKMLIDLNSGANGSYLSQLIAGKNHLYFVVDDSTNGSELWISNGTANGTNLLKDIYSGSMSSNVNSLTIVREYVYFSANDGVHGEELWKTDGTTNGTVMVDDIFKGPSSASPALLTLHNDTLFFVAGHPEYGRELWSVFTNCMVNGFEFDNACVNDSVGFKDLTNSLGKSIIGYKWEFGNGDSSSLKNPKYAYMNPGKYNIKLTVTSSDACTIESTKFIVIDSFPNADFGLYSLDSQCLTGNSFKFKNNSQTGLTYAWKFGNGKTDNTFEPTHSYTSSGSFKVELSVKNTANCESNVSAMVVVLPKPNTPVIFGVASTKKVTIDSFNVNGTVGSTYNWSVLNGNILSGQNTSKIRVSWPTNSTVASVRVTETIANGCVSSEAQKVVNINTTDIVELGTFKLNFYPNPNDGYVYWENIGESSSELQISIIDLYGRELAINVDLNSQFIDMSDLPSGQYFIRISNNNLVKTIHIIKN